VDELLKRLKYSKLGCYVGDLWVAAFAYADDVVLLAPTVRALLDICDDFVNSGSPGRQVARSRSPRSYSNQCLIYR